MRIIGFEDTETPAQVICYRFKSGESLHQGWSWIWLGNALIVVPNATMTKRDEKPHLDRAPRAHSPPESHRWFTPLGKLSCRVRQPCGYNSLVRSIRVPGPLGREPPLRSSRKTQSHPPKGKVGRGWDQPTNGKPRCHSAAGTAAAPQTDRQCVTASPKTRGEPQRQAAVAREPERRRGEPQSSRRPAPEP